MLDEAEFGDVIRDEARAYVGENAGDLTRVARIRLMRVWGASEVGGN